MNKLVLLLAAIAAGYAAFLSWDKKTAFETLHAEVTDLDAKAKTLKSRFIRENKALDDITAELKAESDIFAAVDERFKIADTSIQNRKNAIAESQRELTGVTGELADIEKLLQLEGNIPDLSSLQSELENETSRNTELNQRLEELKLVTAQSEQKIKDARAAISANAAKEAERIRGFAGGAARRSATIAAVDPEWNFVVINTNADGAKAGDRVIVERGGQRVGMLLVDKVSPGKVVANMVEETMSSPVQPGDTAVFDTK